MNKWAFFLRAVLIASLVYLMTLGCWWYVAIWWAVAFETHRYLDNNLENGDGVNAG